MTTNELATRSTAAQDGSIIEAVIAKGDLAKLTPDERLRYYTAVCRSVGLNPFTRPFEYINLSGKLTLYARKDATDQLRKLHNVSLGLPQVTYAEGLVTVTVTAALPSGRTDGDIGVVAIEGLKGEARANAVMKAITKAKRRATLSISGLGWLDETEVEGIGTPVVVDSDTGEIVTRQTNGRAPLPSPQLPAAAPAPEWKGWRSAQNAIDWAADQGVPDAADQYNALKEALKPNGAPAMFKAWQEHVEAGPHPEVLFQEAAPRLEYK